MLAARFWRLITTLWVGSLWTVGYLAAPTVFTTLFDKVLAGTIAGSLFRVEAWLSVFCAIALAALLVSVKDAGNDNKVLLRVIAAMLACTLIGYFALQPWMASLRQAAGPAGITASDAKMQFGILHGVASLLYLIESLLGAVLIFKPAPMNER